MDGEPEPQNFVSVKSRNAILIGGFGSDLGADS
jgi:hypothetical protein